MKRMAIFLAFPYLAPLIVALLIEHCWSYFTHTPPNQAWVSGGEVPSAYIILPLGLILQILIGCSGNWILLKCVSRKQAMGVAIAMSLFPLALIRSSASPNGLTNWLSLMIIPLVIVGIFGLGAIVSYHFLYTRRIQIAATMPTPSQ